MALRPVQRIKHVVDQSGVITANTVQEIVVVLAKDSPTIGNISQVETGSKVYGIYLKVVVASNEATVAGAIPNIYMVIQKSPGGNIANVNPVIVGADDDKRFVLHQEMSMIQNQENGNATVLFDGVVVIPRGFNRFGPNDELRLLIVCPQIDISWCMQSHYKEFR